MRFSERTVIAAFAFVLATGCSAATNSGSSVAPVLPQSVVQRSGDAASESLAMPGQTGCGVRALFVRLDTEIRGYPLNASGVTLPCTLISGPHSQLFERGAIAVSVHGYLHSLSFQADYGLTIHRSYANNDAAPFRSVRVNQDHVALAVDSSVNDYVVASEGYEGDNCWLVVADKQVQSTSENCDTNLSAIEALTTDNRDELIVIGVDAATRASRIDVFAGAATAAPRLVRTIAGSNTGLPVLTGTQGYFDVSYSLATDPRSGDLYVYSHHANVLGLALRGPEFPRVAEFAANAGGNAVPLRVLSGPGTHLPIDAFAVTVVSTDDRGNLYVLSPGFSPIVSVFGPNAQGDATPDRTFTDPTATVGFSGAAIAVRSAVR